MLQMKMNMRSAVLAVVAVASLITGAAMSAMNQYQNQAPQEASLQSFIGGIVNAGACMLGYTDYCQKGEGGQWQVSPEMAKMFKDKVMQSFMGQGAPQAQSQAPLASSGYYGSGVAPQAQAYNAGYGARPASIGYPAAPAAYRAQTQAAAQPGLWDMISKYASQYGQPSAYSNTTATPPKEPGFLSQLLSGLTGSSAAQ